MLLIKSILSQFYQWNLKYALSEDHAARKAVYLFSTCLIFYTVPVVWTLPIDNERKPFVLLLFLLIGGLFFILWLFRIFVKNKNYKKISREILRNKTRVMGMTPPQLSIGFQVFGPVLFILTLFFIYLNSTP